MEHKINLSNEEMSFHTSEQKAELKKIQEKTKFWSAEKIVSTSGGGNAAGSIDFQGAPPHGWNFRNTDNQRSIRLTPKMAYGYNCVTQPTRDIKPGNTEYVEFPVPGVGYCGLCGWDANFI